MAEIEITGLPAELRILARFLQKDDRATAVFDHDLVESEGLKASIVYQNTAFRHLGLSELNLHDVLTKFAESKKKNEDKYETFVATIQGKLWRLAAVRQKWSVLALKGPVHDSEQNGLYSVSNDAIHQSGTESKLTTTNGAETAEPQIPPHSQDWTRFPVPGLTAWIDYVRTFDWSSTCLGPMQFWPEQLREYVMHVMRSPKPRVVMWAGCRTFIYNEACIPLFGEKHPDALGKNASETWSETWSDVEPLVEDAFKGKISKIERVPLAIRRKGFLEETYWDLMALPMTAARGDIPGMFLEVTEATKAVVGERRRASVMKLSQQISSASSLPDLWSRYIDGLESATEDVPFAMLYEVVDTLDGVSDMSNSDTYAVSRKKCVLAGALGVSTETQSTHRTFGLSEHIENTSDIVEPCLQAWKSGMPVTLKKEEGTLPRPFTGAITGRGFGDEMQTVIVSPVTSIGGNDVFALLVTGLNPRSPIDEEYNLYTLFLSDILMKAASLISLPQEQRRAQKIADDMNTALAQQLRMITLQAEQREARFSRMAAEAPTGMFVYDPDGRPLYVNEAFLTALGETREHHDAQSPTTIAWKDQIHPDDLPRFIDAWRRVVHDKAPLTIEHRLKQTWKSMHSGQEVSGETWLLANAFPDVGSDGKVSSIQGWLTDISHRKFAEKLLSRKLEDALEEKRQRENFIDTTSHEMRNPLSAILQSADSIVSALASATMPTNGNASGMNRDIVDEISDAAQTIILCAQHQKRIVDDILTLSKLDASLLEISPDKVHPPKLLGKALKMYEAEIERAGIAAEVEIEPTYNELGLDWVVLDPSRLLQVIINLLTNAIKFTQFAQERNITLYLGASYEAPTGKHHDVNFIPTKHSRPAHSPLDDWGDGERIYLQIAVADCGRGLSEEEMKVLFQRFSQASPKTYSQYGGSGLGLFISRELCELQGGQIGVSSRSGRTSFTFFVLAKKWVPYESSNTSRRPGLKRFASASASPMAFSRRGSEVLQDTNSGAQEQTARVEVVHEDHEANGTIPQIEGSSPTQQLNAAGDKPKLHLLIVEDNLINQKVMSKQLRNAGCVVHVANHGLECLSFLEQTTFCSATTQLSLILLDLEMPTMDGLTCIRQIREQQRIGKILEHIPVIAVTANARSEQISITIEAGMDSVVTKPFRIPELVPQMHSLVAEIAQRRVSEGEASMSIDG